MSVKKIFFRISGTLKALAMVVIIPVPRWRRPAVLPKPEPWPRPIRLRGRRPPAGAFRECRPMRSSAIVFDLHEVPHGAHHALKLRRGGPLHDRADSVQAQRAQGVTLP